MTAEFAGHQRVPRDPRDQQDAIGSMMLRGAVRLAQRGLPVFPIHHFAAGACSCSNPQCASPAKHPRVRWRQQATTDARQLLRWWTRWPSANIGLVTGNASGIIVLDIDPAHGGVESLRQLVDAEGAVAHFAKVRTGGGGEHYYMRHPGGRVRNRTGLRPGIDVRGDGGYVVAPPSLHASGRRYRWEVDQ